MKRIFLFMFFLLLQTGFLSAEDMKNLIRKFDVYNSAVDISGLPESERKCILKLLETGMYIDKIFLKQNFSKNIEIQNEIKKLGKKDLLTLFNIHYGPFDRTDEHKSFYKDFVRPLGGGFYPDDISK